MGVISNNEGGGVHTRAHAGWLNGVLPKRTEGADITSVIVKLQEQQNTYQLTLGTTAKMTERWKNRSSSLCGLRSF